MITRSIWQPLETNHSTPKIADTITTTTPVQPTAHSHTRQNISSIPRTSLNFPPSGNEYLCFHIDMKTTRASQCAKSRALTKVIDLILEILKFEKQCVIFKVLFKSEQLKKYMVTIGIDQLSSNSVL